MSEMSLLGESVIELAGTSIVDIGGMALLAGVVSLLAAVGYRRYSTRAAPAGTPLLLALAIVAGWILVGLATTGAIVGDVALDHHTTATYLLAAFLVTGVVAEAGRRLGDAVACDVYGITRVAGSTEAASLVRAARLGVDVELPATIEDADGYLTVEDGVKADLTGRIVRLPHGLSTADRRARIERRIQRDFDVDYVDASMADDGTVAALSVGRQPSGLGSTLPPNGVAVAVRADPSPKASPGDPIELWATDGTPELVASGTLRAATGGVATVIVDPDQLDALDQSARYRLVTRSDEPTDGYELVSVLRSADETVDVVTVMADGPLADEFVGWLPAQVVVLERDGDLTVFPDESETLLAGDRCWVLGTPAELGALESYEPDASERPPRTADESETTGEETERAGTTTSADDSAGKPPQQTT